MSYDKQQASADFKKGRHELDHGDYHLAIDTFTRLIDLTAPYIGQDKDSKLTWDTSLNNRGVAKCKLGYSTGDKTLYQSGLDDYRTTVETYPAKERQPLTAQSNLSFGEVEIKEFDNLKVAKFRAWDL